MNKHINLPEEYGLLSVSKNDEDKMKKLNNKKEF
jgi:hypothetical protein